MNDKQAEKIAVAIEGVSHGGAEAGGIETIVMAITGGGLEKENSIAAYLERIASSMEGIEAQLGIIAGCHYSAARP